MSQFVYIATGITEQGTIWNYTFATMEEAKEFVSKVEHVVTPEGDTLDMVWEVIVSDIRTPEEALSDFTSF